MPGAIAARAQATVDRIIHDGQRSFGSIAMLTAAPAKPIGLMNSGQVSPTRSVSDFQRKYRNGTRTELDSRTATGSRWRKPRQAERIRPDKVTGSRMNPTRPNWRPI